MEKKEKYDLSPKEKIVNRNRLRDQVLGLSNRDVQVPVINILKNLMEGLPWWCSG